MKCPSCNSEWSIGTKSSQKAITVCPFCGYELEQKSAGLGRNISDDLKNCLTVFFMLDTSCNMQGASIAELNESMRKILGLFREDRVVANGRLNVKIAVLTFDSKVHWKTSCPIELSQYVYEDLAATGRTCTAFDKACEELSSKLDKNAWLHEPSGFYFPEIIIISSGSFSNISGQGLKNLKGNMFYKYASKMAICIGKDSSNFNNIPELKENFFDISSNQIVKYIENRFTWMINFVDDVPYDRGALLEFCGFDEDETHERWRDEVSERLKREAESFDLRLFDEDFDDDEDW